MAAIHDQGLNSILVHLRTLFTHVGVSTDNTAFSTSQTRLDPGAAGTNLISAASNSNVDNDTDDYTINVTSANFGGNNIYTIGLQDGATATDNVSRSVRTNPIGVESSGDDFTVGVRVSVSDQSA
jgi:hypothetical protein